MHKNFIPAIEQAIALNTADKMGATDKAMDEFITRCGCDKAALKKKHLPDGKNSMRFPFTSTRKRMSTIIENATGKGGYDKRIFIKGGSDVILDICNKYMDENGEIKPLTDVVKGSVNNIINKFAADALRTLCLAYKDI